MKKNKFLYLAGILVLIMFVGCSSKNQRDITKISYLPDQSNINNYNFMEEEKSNWRTDLKPEVDDLTSYVEETMKSIDNFKSYLRKSNNIDYFEPIEPEYIKPKNIKDKKDKSKNELAYEEKLMEEYKF